MRAAPGLFRRQSLRLRITLTFVGTAAMLALALSLTTFFASRSFLLEQRIRSTTRQTQFGMIFANEVLRDPAVDAEDLVSLLQARGDFQTMVTTPEDWFATSISLTPDTVPNGLRALVSQERFGYQIAPLAPGRAVVFGAPLPPARTDIFFFYSLDAFDDTMGTLARVLSIAGAAVVAVAAAVAQRVSTRLLRPLGEVSGAAQRVAEGLLETRVRAASGDEVGLLAASFNEMAGALQEMIDRERRFVADVSHELRTPLSALRTASEVLAGHAAALAPPAREAAGLIAEDVADLHRLVEELMEVSAVDARTAEIRLEPVDVRTLVEAIVARRRRDAVVEGSCPTTLSDKARLERIVANLVDNAYVHGEGRDVRIAIWAEDDGRRCVVEVSDAGPGIDAADVPRLFERFYRTDRSRSRVSGGSGLGLAIAQENARLLGGAIEARSEPGRGSSFTLRLPLRAAEDGS